MPPNSLAQKLVEVMKSVDSVPKNGYNEFHRYPYMLEADVMRAVRGKLAELGVLVLTSVEKADKLGDITVVHTLHTFIDSETGEKLEVKGYGQGQDKGDKAGYKAITGACKYQLSKSFLIPTGDDPEKDEGSNGQPNGAPPPQQPKAKNGQQAKREVPQQPQAPKPEVSTPDQQQQIKQLAEEVGLDVEDDILAKLEIKWPPNRYDADRILKRLRQIKDDPRRRNGSHQ